MDTIEKNNLYSGAYQLHLLWYSEVSLSNYRDYTHSAAMTTPVAPFTNMV